MFEISWYLAGKGGFGGCLSVGGPYAERIGELAWMAMLGADGCIRWERMEVKEKSPGPSRREAKAVHVPLLHIIIFQFNVMHKRLLQRLDRFQSYIYPFSSRK